LGSVCDAGRMNAIFSTWLPDSVFHAAAYKHVLLVERNPIEGIKNNVMGTYVCAKLSNKYKVRNFTLVSSDKAVRPTNIMGATKRFSELIVQSLAANSAGFLGETIFSMVRFGNVLGSSGSVVPLFREQISRQGPVTVTHPDVTRFFMSISEAAQLVIQASALSNGGEVFVLDMGEPIRILDLAKRMIALSGLRVKDNSNSSGDIEIAFTGLKPGEKLYEELLIGDSPEKTLHPKIMRARENFLEIHEIEILITDINSSLEKGALTDAINILKSAIKGFNPHHEIVDWVYVESSASVS